MNLNYKVQNYEWGKLGSTSVVAQLAKSARSDLGIDEGTPYAELWMGTHPNGPSTIASSDESLADYVNAHPECLGPRVVEAFGEQLPFLFKVLSVAKALSIQAHPNKNHAEKLHATRPDLYKDPNHKPELAIALTPFEAMCGFRPVDEIKRFLQNVPELNAMVGSENVMKLLSSDEAGLSKCLRDCFYSFMTQPPDFITAQLNTLLTRLGGLDESSRASQLAPLVERLSAQFPNDVGCFAAYFLNVIHLCPGESLYLGPNEPHAYLSGDCIECMACSDNVVRAGLTPKFKDVETLCNMLTYSMESPETKLFAPRTENEYTTLYAPPVRDFAVAKIQVPAGSALLDVIGRDSASIILVVSGEGKSNDLSLRKGTVYFLAANQQFPVNDVSVDLLMFQAFANV